MGRKIIIGVPGSWETHAHIFAAIADTSDRFLLQPGVDILVDTDTGHQYALDIYGHDPDLAKAFSVAGRTWITQPDLDTIASHKLTVYALSRMVGITTAKRMLQVGCVLLNAGGMAVKVESTGVAHSAAKWAEFAQTDDLYNLYCAYVVVLKGLDYYYSCGMHNFGLPEVSTRLTLSPEAAAELMNEFNFYRLSKNPSIRGGERFRAAPNMPVYRVKKAIYEFYEPENPFYNPFGRWHLA